MYSDNVQNIIATGILRFFGFFVIVILQDAVTYYMAYKRGDVSPGTKERATLNPIPHISLFGTILFPFFTIILNIPILFGWTKEHSINSRYFKKPRKDINIIYSTNLISIFALGLIVYVTLSVCLIDPFKLMTNNGFLSIESLQGAFFNLLASVYVASISLGSLFLLPFPGFAGWKLLINNLSYNNSSKILEKQNIFYFSSLLFIVFFGKYYVGIWFIIVKIIATPFILLAKNLF